MKGKTNFIIDAVMFLLLAAIAGLGFLMKYILLPGEGRLAKFGRHVDLSLFGLDRHEWGTIHLILGLVLLGLVALHIVLHWESILCLFHKLIGKKQWRFPSAVVFAVLSLLLLIFPFMVRIDVVDAGPGKNHRSLLRSIDDTASVEETMTDSNRDIHGDALSTAKVITPKHQSAHVHENADIRVQGFMTLEEVAYRYAIPVDSILSGLKIIDTIRPSETFGRLRKKYPFQMIDVERIIREYKTDIRK